MSLFNAFALAVYVAAIIGLGYVLAEWLVADMD